MFGLLSAMILGGKLIKEACEPTLPANIRANKKLYEEDCNKVRFGKMTQKQLEKNVRNGKYLAPEVDHIAENKKAIDEFLSRHKGLSELYRR